MSCRKSRQSRASRLRIGNSKLSPPALALFAALPDEIVRADAAAAAVLADVALPTMRTGGGRHLSVAASEHGRRDTAVRPY